MSQAAPVPPPLAAAAWWACVAAVSALVMVPLLVVDVPPVLDYPNHLARMVVLATGRDDPELAQMYVAHWGLIPNLAMDLIVPPLLHVMPVYWAGRLFLAVALLLPLAGVLAYHRAVFGVRSLWPVGAALFACNGLFLLGFLNFLVATGLALLAAAAWVHGRRHRPLATAVLCSAALAGIFFCHLFGVLLFMILAASREAEALLRCRQPRAALASVALLATAVAPVTVLGMASRFSGEQSPAQWGTALVKLVGLLQPVLNYHAGLDMLTAIAVAACVGLCLAYGHWRAPPASVIAVTALAGLYAAMPFTMKGGAWVDARFIVAAGFVLFAGFIPHRLPRWAGVALAGGCACLLVARTGVVASAWVEHRADLRDLRHSIAAVPAGARVLVVRVSPQADPAFWATAPRSRHVTGSTTTEVHDAALLLIERRAFWPLLFANPAQQPVSVQPAYRADAAPIGVPPDYHALLARPPTAADLAAAPYLRDWQHHFDNVLVLDAEAVPDLAALLPATLTRLNQTGFAALYRVGPAATLRAAAID